MRRRLAFILAGVSTTLFIGLPATSAHAGRVLLTPPVSLKTGQKVRCLAANTDDSKSTGLLLVFARRGNGLNAGVTNLFLDPQKAGYLEVSGGDVWCGFNLTDPFPRKKLNAAMVVLDTAGEAVAVIPAR